MKTIQGILLMAAASMLMTACVKGEFDNVPSQEPTDEGKARAEIAQAFDYSLDVTVPVQLHYSRGGVLVEIYDRDTTTLEAARSTVRPRKLYAAFTGADGNYEGQLTVPSSYIGTKVYAFSKNIGVASKVEATITASGLVVNEQTRAVALGKTGVPAGVRDAIEKVLPEGRNNTDRLGAENDINLRVKKDCHIDVTFVWGGAGVGHWTGFWGSPNDGPDVWKCQNGESEPAWTENNYTCNLYYFTYTDDKVPTAEEIRANFINDEHLVIAGADQGSSNDLMGTTVRLTVDGQTTIPAGTRIGWVVTHPQYRLKYAWTSDRGSFQEFKTQYDVTTSDNSFADFAAHWEMPYIYSLDALNPDGRSQSIRYTYGTGDDEVLVYGIEDLSVTRGNFIWGEEWGEHAQHIDNHVYARFPFYQMKSDLDYNDVMFTVKADPIDAIVDDGTPEMPEVEDNYSEESYEGTLLYEDLYPAQGDYDMNDVVIAYKLIKYFDKDNRMVRLGYEFTPVWNGADYHSSFSFLIDDIVTEPVLVIDDHAKYVTAYQQTAQLKTFKGDVSSGRLVGMNKDELKWSAFNPYITVSNTGYEVHLTKKAPSANAKLDGLDLYQRAYVNDSNFPFAMNVPVKDFQVVTERTRIDAEYPDFVNWVVSKGSESTNWYQHKK